MGSPTLITLDDALTGVTVLGFDTSPFIYFIERHPNYVELMREIIRRIDVGSIAGYSSAVTLTEVLTKPKQAGDTVVENAYRTLLLGSRNFTILPIDTAIADSAADLRARYRLRTPDALQLAAAIQAGCQAFITNDGLLRRVADIRILVLSELTL